MATRIYKVAGVDKIFVEIVDGVSVGIVFDVDITDEDSVDVTFPGSFSFTGDYSIEITEYITEASAVVDFNIVPRAGDPIPPAAKSGTGFRILFSAPVTGRLRIWAHQ